jgi:hypothetical protein
VPPHGNISSAPDALQSLSNFHKDDEEMPLLTFTCSCTIASYIQIQCESMGLGVKYVVFY